MPPKMRLRMAPFAASRCVGGAGELYHAVQVSHHCRGRAPSTAHLQHEGFKLRTNRQRPIKIECRYNGPARRDARGVAISSQLRHGSHREAAENDARDMAQHRHDVAQGTWHPDHFRTPRALSAIAAEPLQE